jgi:hypothetical protein
VTTETPAAIVAKLKQQLDALVAHASTNSLKANERRRVDAEVRSVISGLETLLRQIDPIRQPTAVFDPSNPKIIGRFIALALVAQKRLPLGALQDFYGSGVYAIYYVGDFEAYRAVSKSETPVYVGQAAPATNTARTPVEQGDRLTKRLSEHARNIAKATSTLSLDDFECRALVVQSGHETAAEDYLIHLFRPIWNNETGILYGLGKHGDAAETRGNKRSPWDTLHPGRKWAGNTILADARSPSQIANDLAEHFKKHAVFKDVDEVLKEFIEELRQV